MRLALSALMLALLALVTACGADDETQPAEHGRPTVDEIALAIKDPDNAFHEPFAMLGKGAALDCVAEVLHDSDLSDDALRALLDEQTDFADNEPDHKAMSEVTDEMAGCITS
jgi:hypothetical protein